MTEKQLKNLCCERLYNVERIKGLKIHSDAVPVPLSFIT